ncbi:MAG: hypothetical protein ACQEWD_12175 [Bacteroidota bacterium]
MRKILYILIIGLLIISCQSCKSDKADKEELFFPAKADFADTSKLVFHRLESFDNYQSLFKAIDSVTCADKKPVLQFENKKYKFNLIALAHCSEANSVVDYRLKNVIGINNDSIIVNREIKTTVADLREIMAKHYLNYGKNSDYSERPEKAVINLYLEPKTDTGKIENLLEKIATEFYDLKKGEDDNFRLMILFKDYPMEIFPIPPMPEN